MKYFFTLGNNPTLSVAELSAVFGLGKDTKEGLVNKNVFILETEEEIDCGEVIRKIGGTIKIGEIIDSALMSDDDLDFKLTELVIEKHDEENKKLKFGVSCYGEKGLDVKNLAMNIKNNLKGNKISSSWVVGKRRDEPVSSVAVEGNKLMTKGIELILIKNGEEVLIGKTLVVQPFKELSFRDYNRPARDDRSGMIPPKLAQMMLNLACVETPRRGVSVGDKTKNKVIYDPFCGSGTILTEAILMGRKTIIGSDISQKAVKNTQENIKWTKDQYKLGKINANIFLSDASSNDGYLKKKIVDAIVTEPYLGPQRGRFDVERVIRELNRLYSNSLKGFEKILKLNGRVVMIWPIFRIKKKLFKINPSLGNFKIINPISHSLLQNESVKPTDRKTIIYGRKRQRVWREIVVLEMKRA